MYKAIAKLQKYDGKVLFIDCDMSTSPDYVASFDVDIDSVLWVSFPENVERVFHICDTCVAPDVEIDLLVIKNIDALYNGDWNPASIQNHQDSITTQMEILRELVQKHNRVAVVFVNSTRRDFLDLFGNPFLDPTASNEIADMWDLRIALAKRAGDIHFKILKASLETSKDTLVQVVFLD